MRFFPPPLTSGQEILKQRIYLLIHTVQDYFDFVAEGISYKAAYEILYEFMDADPELVEPLDLATMLESYIKIHRGN